MADAHEGMSLSLKANFAQVNEAKKATQALNSALGELQRRANSLHMSANFPREINHIDTVTASYIRRLESEGKTYEANQQKVKAYHSAIAELSSKQNELRSALDKAKDAASRNSDAYRTQRIRFNENVAEINRYKAGLRSVNEEMRKANPNFWDEVKSHLHSTNTEAEKTHSLFKTIFSANLVSNAVTGGFNLVRNNIGGMIRSAHEYNVQQQTMNATWLTLTGNAHKGKAMVDQIDSMAAAAQNDTKMVDTLSQKFYAINKSPQQTAQITKSVLTLQDAFGATDASVENFGTQFSQMMANQKVSAQDMMSFVNVFPEYRTQLLKTVDKQQHTKLSMKQMNAEMSKGKISSKVAIEALEQMAHHYKNATGNFTKTIPGMIRTVKSQMPRLMSAFDRPFTKVENPILKQVSDWSTSSKTRKAFSHLGSVVSHGMNKVMNTAFSSGGRRQTTVGQVLNSGIYKAAAATKKLFNYLAIHGKDIKTIGKSGLSIAGTIGKGVWKDFSAIAINIGKAFGLIGKNADKNGGTLRALAQGLNNLSKNKTALKAISDYIVLVASTKGIKNVTSPLINLGTKGAHTFQAVRGISRGLSGIADANKIKKMGELETHFFNIGKGARDAAKAIGAFSKKIGISSLFGGKAAAKAGPQAVLDATAKGNRKWFTAPLESIRHAGGFKNLTLAGKLANGAAGVGVALDAGSQFVNAYKDRHDADKRSQDIGQGIGSAIGGGIGMYFGGPLGAMVGSQLGKVAGKWGGTAVNNFTKGWQKHKPPKNFWSLENLGWSTKDMFGKMAKGWNSFWGGMGNWRKKQSAGFSKWTHQMSSGIGKWASDVGKGWNKGVKGVGKWIHDIPSNIGKTGTSIKNWAGNVGNNIHKGFDTATRNTHNFFKSLPKNTRKTGSNIKNWASKTGRNIGKGINSGWKKAKTGVSNFGKWYGKKWNDIWKSVNNNRYVKAFKKGQLFQTAFKDMKSRWNAFSKWFGKGWNGFWAKIGKWAKNSWNGIKQNWNNFWGSLPKKWEAFKKGFAKGWSNFWGGIKKAWDNSIGGIIKAWNGFTGKLGAFGKWAKNSWTGTKNNVKGFTNRMIYGAGGKKTTFKYDKFAHANGGTMHTTHGALVGEAGPELAYKPYANHVRLLGANGPQFTKVHAGEHILNARDTAKVLNGGLGNGLTLKGYASGTDKLGKTSKKVTNDYKQIAEKSSKSLNNLSKKSSSTWNKITRQTGKDSSKTRKRAISDYSDIHKGIVKQMDKTHDGVISLSESTAKGFGKALDKTKGYARDAMSDSIGEINKGITGIDKVLGQFGGNTSVIKPVKFATGTDANGRLTENTLAMVNDAQTGPRQEALVSDKNELFLPRGNNVTMMLPKGWGVLNGTQTQQVAKSAGVKHFAKGSGLSHSALRKLAEKAGANPAQSFKEMFLDKLKPSGSNLKRGSIGLAQNSSQHFGNPWSNAMWTVINNAIGGGDGKGGTREAFLKYAESTFTGVPYLMGAASKTLSDCSGMIMQALRHFGINIGRTTVAMQESSGVQYLGKSLSKTLPGDLVIFGHGTGAAGHVGIIKNPRTGTMFNETPPHARVTRIADDKGMGYGYYRVRGLHNASQSKKHAQANKSLIALAKRELGSSAIKWIKDKLGDDFGSLGSFSIGGDLRDRARALAGGLKKLDPRATRNGIAAVLGNWNFESGGLNPGAVNSGGGASGLGQWLGGRLSNLKAYARRHGTSWKNVGTQLSFAVKGEGSDSAILRSILEGHGSVASLANRFSSEWERGGYNAQHVQGAMQIRKALGFAKGGKPKAHTPFIAGERGPELITADGPIKVDTHEQTKRKLSDLVNLVDPKINRPTHRNNSAPIININFNGPIGGSIEDAKRIAEIVKREITQYLVNIGDEFGTDPSLY